MKKIANLGSGPDYTEVWYDEMEDRMVHNYVQNTFDACLEQNKREYSQNMASGNGGAYKSEVANKVASIPMETILRWKQEEGLDIFQSDPETQRRLRRKLNSPEYQYLRTRPGRV